MLGDLNELRTFQRIVACGSLSAAARDLGVGLAVVSKRLASLERRAGQRLIHRTTRRLSPTSEGLALMPHIERMLEELAAAEARLASGKEEPHGLLRVSAPISFGRSHLVPLAAELVERYPQLDIALQLADTVVDLTEERIDIALRVGEPRDSTAVIRKLAPNRRILVAAPSYLDRHGRPRLVAELSRHVCLHHYSPTVSWRLEGPNGAVVEVETHSRLCSNSSDALQDWALAGRGVTLESAVEVAEDLASRRLERVLPDWQTAPAPIYALLPSGRLLATKTRVFLDAIVAALGDT